jgi:F0F1-type ATP synthase membrane subunit c/vacuolar-type H+-ATPase subunit K
MNPQITTLNIIRAAFLVAVALYMFIGEKVGSNVIKTSPGVFQAMAAVSIMTIVAIFIMRRVIVLPAVATLRTQSQDNPALLRWRTGYLITYALCEAVALYGLVLRILGFPFAYVVPFYIASAGLMLYYRPQFPEPEAMAAARSA